MGRTHLEEERTTIDASPIAPADSRPPWRRALTRNVLWLGLVSLFADISSEMLYPLMPIFLTVTLAAPVAVVGVIEGVAEATAAILKTVSGRIADRTGKRLGLVFGGYTVSALAKPVIALAHVWPLVLFARVLDRTGKGLRDSPRDAIIADSSPPGVGGAAFGWHRAMDTLGAVAGPLLALGLVSLAGGNLRLVIGLAAIPGLIGALLVLRVADPRRRRAASRPSTAEAGTEASHERLRWASVPPAFKAYLTAWLPFVLVNSSDVFLILRAKQMGFSTVAVVVLYTLYNLFYAAASVPLGHLSDRIGRRKVLIGGMVAFAAVYVGFAFSGAPWHVIALFAVYGLYIAATDGVGKAFAIDLVPGHLRATAIGLLGTLTGVFTFAASTIAGVLWDSVGSWAPFVLGAAGAVVSALLFAFLPQLRTGPTQELP